jgi:hypothetical protein
MSFSAVILFALAALPTKPLGVPPGPCDGAVILPSQVAFNFQGNASGCTQSGGTCIAGETIVFTAVTMNPCIMSRFWQFPGDPVIAGTTINHVFASPGSFTVTMTAVGPTNSVQVAKTVIVAPSSAISTLSPSVIAFLLISMTLVAMQRLRH